jgi:hypothetical protein
MKVETFCEGNLKVETYGTYLMQETMFRLSSTVDAAVRHLWTANLYLRERKSAFTSNFVWNDQIVASVPSFRIDVPQLVKVSNLELLLEKDSDDLIIRATKTWYGDDDEARWRMQHWSRERNRRRGNLINTKHTSPSPSSQVNSTSFLTVRTYSSCW